MVFPFNPYLLEALQKLETCYWKGKVKLCDVVNDVSSSTSSLGGEGFGHIYSLFRLHLTHLSSAICCLRAILSMKTMSGASTLALISPSARQRILMNVSVWLGKSYLSKINQSIIVRTIVPPNFPSLTLVIAIDIPLGRNTHSPKNLDKIQSALIRWDDWRRGESRNESSREFWDVLYCLQGVGFFLFSVRAYLQGAKSFCLAFLWVQLYSLSLC